LSVLAKTAILGRNLLANYAEVAKRSTAVDSRSVSLPMANSKEKSTLVGVREFESRPRHQLLFNTCVVRDSYYRTLSLRNGRVIYETNRCGSGQ
jgi:hypothetical protein